MSEEAHKEKTTLHGKSVYYDPSDYNDAVRYLRDELGDEEARALFDEAKDRPETGAYFKTSREGRYSLFYRNYVFEISDYHDRGGWF